MSDTTQLQSEQDQNETEEWPQPLSAEERDRIEERTWNSPRIIVQPGEKGPGIPLTQYQREQEEQTKDDQAE